MIGGLLALLTVAASLQPDPVRTVAAVDLDRYLGEWFEIARFPNRFQRACTGDVRATYARRSDGRIDVVNRCRAADGRVIEAQGVARVVDARTSAKLKVRFAPAVLSFLPFVWGDYWIVGLADDYSWAVVGSPDRAYLWILARSRMLDTARLDAARAAARATGFDTDRLVMTRHISPDPR
jgi:apolipoprotein D and lipocalin family protein